MAEFSEADVTVTLKGKEWFAILARLDLAIRGKKARPLSAAGTMVYKKAMDKLTDKLKESAGCEPGGLKFSYDEAASPPRP